MLGMDHHIFIGKLVVLIFQFQVDTAGVRHDVRSIPINEASASWPSSSLVMALSSSIGGPSVA
jgi:hypothetical protein